MKKRILIIDDEASVRKAFQLALLATDYEVELASSGQDGIDKALASDYDLVYLDLRMPDKDGIAVLREIREHKPALLVYITTAFHREYFQDLVKARSEGLSFELLAKPLERDQIIKITRGILEGAFTMQGGGAVD